jgi:hypothetical protein
MWRWIVKLNSALLAGALCAGLLLGGGAAPALADGREAPISRSAGPDARAPAAAQPGTAAEAREYEKREAESPEVREFSGGEVVVGISFGVVLLAALIVVLVLLLQE